MQKKSMTFVMAFKNSNKTYKIYKLIIDKSKEVSIISPYKYINIILGDLK